MWAEGVKGFGLLASECLERILGFGDGLGLLVGSRPWVLFRLGLSFG